MVIGCLYSPPSLVGAMTYVSKGQTQIFKKIGLTSSRNSNSIIRHYFNKVMLLICRKVNPLHVLFQGCAVRDACILRCLVVCMVIYSFIDFIKLSCVLFADNKIISISISISKILFEKPYLIL